MVSRNNRLRSMRGRSLTVDFSQLVDFQERIQQLSETQLDNYFREVLRELGLRLMAKAHKKTPVDTGLLRRNWGMTKVIDRGSYYEIMVVNPTDYAAYVELGHRTRDHKNWVNGYFMLHKATLEVESEMKDALERELKKFLEEKLDVK